MYGSLKAIGSFFWSVDTWIIVGGVAATIGLLWKIYRDKKHDAERRTEMKKADLRAELCKKGTEYGLYVMNVGRAMARNIRAIMDALPLPEHKAAALGDSLPIQVGPGETISCSLGIDFDCHPPFSLTLLWDDDFDSNREYTTTLTSSKESPCPH